MLQDKEQIEASYIFYIKVGTLKWHDQSNICVLTVIIFEIVMLTIQYCLMFTVCFMSDSGDFLR